MDKISSPAKGRYFPISIGEAIQMITGMQFAVYSTDYKRISLEFCNPASEHEFGIQIADFHPKSRIIIYSHAEEFPLARAKNLLNAAIQEFLKIDKQNELKIVENGYKISYHTYFTTLNQLTITKHKRKAMRSKYRSLDKFSNAFKPKKIRTDEVVISSIKI